jgi:hypothetical protein
LLDVNVWCFVHGDELAGAEVDSVVEDCPVEIAVEEWEKLCIFDIVVGWLKVILILFCCYYLILFKICHPVNEIHRE